MLDWAAQGKPGPACLPRPAVASRDQAATCEHQGEGQHRAIVAAAAAPRAVQVRKERRDGWVARVMARLSTRRCSDKH